MDNGNTFIGLTKTINLIELEKFLLVGREIYLQCDGEEYEGVMPHKIEFLANMLHICANGKEFLCGDGKNDSVEIRLTAVSEYRAFGSNFLMKIKF